MAEIEALHESEHWTNCSQGKAHTAHPFLQALPLSPLFRFALASRWALTRSGDPFSATEFFPNTDFASTPGVFRGLRSPHDVWRHRHARRTHAEGPGPSHDMRVAAGITEAAPPRALEEDAHLRAPDWGLRLSWWWDFVGAKAAQQRT